MLNAKRNSVFYFILFDQIGCLGRKLCIEDTRQISNTHLVVYKSCMFCTSSFRDDQYSMYRNRAVEQNILSVKCTMNETRMSETILKSVILYIKSFSSV